MSINIFPYVPPVNQAPTLPPQTVFPQSRMMTYLDARMAASGFSSPFLAAYTQIKADLLAYRQAIVNGTVAAHPAYLPTFNEETLAKLRAFYEMAFLEGSLQRKYALMWMSEAFEFLDLDLLTHTDRLANYVYWEGQTELYGEVMVTPPEVDDKIITLQRYFLRSYPSTTNVGNMPPV